MVKFFLFWYLLVMSHEKETKENGDENVGAVLYRPAFANLVKTTTTYHELLFTFTFCTHIYVQMEVIAIADRS